MSDKRLAKIEKVRTLRRDGRQRDYTRAKSDLDRADFELRSLIAQRAQLAIDIVKQTESESEALVNSIVEATSLSSIHDAWKRRQGGLVQVDQNIQKAQENRNQLAQRAEHARITYVKSVRDLDRWSQFTSRLNERFELEQERLSELSQDLVVRNRVTGKWVVRSTA